MIIPQAWVCPAVQYLEMMHRWAGAAAFILLGTIFLLLCHTYPHYSLLARTGNGMSYLGLDLVQ